MEVDDVIAHAIYDPVARRQRYLRKRQLKGRQPGQQGAPFPKAGQGSRVVDANMPGSTRHVNLTELAAKHSAERQIAAIRGRLSALKAHLAELLAKKKQASTSSKPATKSTASSSATKPATPAQPKTAKQKAAAKASLKKAQLARASQQKAVPNQVTPATTLTLDEQITRTRAVIADVETKLRTAIEQLRTQTASNGR